MASQEQEGSKDLLLEELRIRSDAVMRLSSDKVSFEKQLHKDRERLQHLQHEQSRDQELAKQRRIIEDRTFMLPYVKRQLMTETSALQELMQIAEDLDETDVYTNAMDVLLTAKRLLND